MLQDVLGSKGAKQPADAGTLDAIQALVQKLPLAERNSLNSLLAAQLKSSGSAGAIFCLVYLVVHASDFNPTLKGVRS